MSLGKFLAGTTLATPAIGGAGYVVYEEVTKTNTEETVSANEQEQRSDGSQRSSEEAGRSANIQTPSVTPGSGAVSSPSTSGNTRAGTSDADARLSSDGSRAESGPIGTAPQSPAEGTPQPGQPPVAVGSTQPEAS